MNTAHLSCSGIDNDSQGFRLEGVSVSISETGTITITGTDPMENIWALSVPVELLSTMKGNSDG